jgi:hypothetical protein
MRYVAVALLLACMVMPISGQDKPDGPTGREGAKNL